MVSVLERESRQLVLRLRLWTPARWAADAPGYGTRADLVRHLAQCFADEAADLEGRPHRPVPRLPVDLTLADQLAVTADDLVRAGPTPASARSAVLHLLTHRSDLLADPIPDSLTALLACADDASAQALGRAACAAATS